MEEKFKLTQEDVNILNSNKGLTALLSKEPYNLEKAVRYVNYEKKIKKLQVELIRLQHWAIDENERIIIIFEGRDAAGKGGAIRRATERMNPRQLRIVALPKPSVEERTQWYFQRYVNQFPKAGEILFFDRSWYNRAVVEPVNGFCTQEEYDIFMSQVNDFERMITESGIRLVKIYMSISKNEQRKRFDEIKSDPLKQWKMTDVDERAQELWDVYTEYKSKMFDKAKEGNNTFKIIRANKKTFARVGALEYILKKIPYNKNREV
tara:strand:- start:57 stop:848 length:792 start_codon:yes stop_codon:yes gene_type:complete